jgi:Trk K+ transport system NAD-binding subunit
MKRRRKLQTLALYLLQLARQFRWTFVVLALLVLIGGALYAVTPIGGSRPTPWNALYASWMALFAQSPFQPPATWYLALVCAVYPLFGVILVGEGIVRLSLLVISKEQGEKEWMKVMASTYRDHVVLCGIGHLGFRILGQLVASGTEVVALEKDADARFMREAKETGVPVLVRDMKDDQALIDAGIPHARTVIIATNDDMANLEVALDSRRMNPKIRIIMRMFDQQIASKVKDALEIDQAFSSAALAAPVVAAMSAGEGKVLASYPIGGVPHTTAELAVAPGGALDGRSIAELERTYTARVLGHVAKNGASPSPPPADTILRAGDLVVVHAAADRLATIASAAASSVAAAAGSARS